MVYYNILQLVVMAHGVLVVVVICLCFSMGDIPGRQAAITVGCKRARKASREAGEN